MGNISFGNLSNQQMLSPELQKRIESQENFTAIDAGKLKQDTVEITKKVVKENFIYRALRNFGVEDPKKFLKSVGLTAITIAGFTAMGSRFNKQIIEFSHKVDDFVKKTPAIKSIGDFGSKIKKRIGDFFDGFSFTKDIKETFAKRRAKCTQPMAMTYITGAKGQFSYNVMDTVQALHHKLLGKDFIELKKVFGHGFAYMPKARKKALEFIKELKKSELLMDEILATKKTGVTAEKIQELVKKCVDIDELGKGAQKKQKLQILLAEVKKLGFTDEKEALSIVAKIDGMSGCEAGLRKIKARLGDTKAAELVEKMKNGNRALEASVRKLIGEDHPDLQYYYKNFMDIDSEADRAGFAQRLTAEIAKKHGLNPDDADYPKKLAQLLQNIKDGKMGDEYALITMNREGIFQGWSIWNGIDKLGSKIFKGKWKPFAKGNLGEALIRFNMADGTLASTAAGKLVQKIPLFLGESVSNNVADLATINMIISVPMLVSLFNTVQEAPKEQKVATLADNFVGGLGQMALSLPITSSIVYGAASLKNIKGNNPLKWIGSIIGMGLPKITDKGIINETNILKRFGGGAFRLWAIMFFLSPKISDLITKGVHKIFGKPYDKEEEQKAKELEEQAKQIIPELGISQGEFLEKLQKNPQAIQRLQTDIKLAQMAQANPKIILDLLDGKEVDTSTFKPAYDGSKLISPLNSKILANRTNKVPSQTSINSNVQNSATQEIADTTVQKQNNSTSVDTATYIPSSTFNIQTSLSPEQQTKYDAMMTKADKALANAQKYI